MSNDYFNHVANRIASGVKARSANINSIADEVALGFDKFPSQQRLAQSNQSMVTDTGTADAYVVTFTAPVPTSYADGMLITMRALNTNTGASTINVNSLGLKSIKRADGTALAADDITAGEIYNLWYDSSTGYFRMQHTSTRFSVRNASGTLVQIGV